MTVELSKKHEKNLMDSVDTYITQHFLNSNSANKMEKKIAGNFEKLFS